jgi:hypothetical protein
MGLAAEAQRGIRSRGRPFVLPPVFLQADLIFILFPGIAGVVKYAGYDNGTILCKEGVIVNGLNPNMKIYLLGVLGWFISLIVFVISLLGATGIAFFILRRRKRQANGDLG